MPYQVRRFELCGSSMSSYENIAQFSDLNSAEIKAKDLFLIEYGSDKFAPLYFYESIASYFDVEIPEGLVVNTGFPVLLIAANDDINERLDKWWELEAHFMIHPYWEVIRIDEENDDSESCCIIAPDYCLDDDRIFLNMTIIM